MKTYNRNCKGLPFSVAAIFQIALVAFIFAHYLIISPQPTDNLLNVLITKDCQ